MTHARRLSLVLLLGILATAFAVDHATSSGDDLFSYKAPEIPHGDKVVYVETFDDENAAKRWTVSSAPEFTGSKDQLSYSTSSCTAIARLM